LGRWQLRAGDVRYARRKDLTKNAESLPRSGRIVRFDRGWFPYQAFATMGQNSRLKIKRFWRSLGAALAPVALLLTAFFSLPGPAPRAEAAQPKFQAVPAPRVAPKPAPSLRASPTPRIAPNSGAYRPGVPDASCSSSCGSRCQLIGCGGLNVSQCMSIRQNCRLACRSRC
jgi:hypothetical protein